MILMNMGVLTSLKMADSWGGDFVVFDVFVQTVWQKFHQGGHLLVTSYK